MANDLGRILSKPTIVYFYSEQIEHRRGSIYRC
jgi:hypothetical protein